MLRYSSHTSYISPAQFSPEVDSQRVTISGIADLVHETETWVALINYKTDSTRRAQSEYRKQLSVYYHTLSEWSGDKDLTESLFYMIDKTRKWIELLSLDK